MEELNGRREYKVLYEENNGLTNSNWVLIRRKKAREIRDTRRRRKLQA